MKKLLLTSTFIFACMTLQPANAQNFLSKLLSGAAQAATNSNGDAKEVGQNVLGDLVNSAIGAAGASTGENSLLGNLISSVTGNVTTTQANLIGSWSYAEPAVQFESENYLTQAGGSAIATKIEGKLGTYYKMVGIKPGKMTFTFDNEGNVTYGVGSVTRNGTYTFNSKDKTLTITTSTGASVKAYVTISGNDMELCFDATKLLSLMNTISSKFSSLKTVTNLASQYNGMKVGFGFTKK